MGSACSGTAPCSLASALAAGGAVAAGPVAFVGLMVPHLVRSSPARQPAPCYPPAPFREPAFLWLFGDLLARLVSRTVEVPVGIVTALMGVPFFLLLLHRSRR